MNTSLPDAAARAPTPTAKASGARATRGLTPRLMHAARRRTSTASPSRRTARWTNALDRFSLPTERERHDRSAPANVAAPATSCSKKRGRLATSAPSIARTDSLRARNLDPMTPPSRSVDDPRKVGADYRVAG